MPFTAADIAKQLGGEVRGDAAAPERVGEALAAALRARGADEILARLARGEPGEEDPAGLDHEAVEDRRVVVEAAGEDRDGEIHLVVIGQVLREAEKPFRHQVEREDLSAEDRLEGHGEDHQTLDFQKPKAHQAEAVGDAELDEC